jgi:hypothetical protein
LAKQANVTVVGMEKVICSRHARSYSLHRCLLSVCWVPRSAPH